MYHITQYSFRKAKELGVIIKPSKKKNKKIDVFQLDKKKNENIYICSIGSIDYKDYPTYLQEDKKLAEERRRLYYIRHKNDAYIKGTPGYYAAKILW
jgi:hypothetical protein